MGGRAIFFALFSCAVLSLVLASAQKRGGRYDDQIRAEVAQVLAGKSDYNDVKAEVEDSIVTLSGSVALDSTRRDLLSRVRRIAHVNGVENRLALSPPAPPDNILLGRLQRRLADAGFDQITLQVHEGAVILKGMVGTVRARNWVTQLAWDTEGVKEVDSQVTVAQPDGR